MSFELPALPYDRHSLEPHLSATTLDAHYSGHHLACLKRLNARLENTSQTAGSLELLLWSEDEELAWLAAEAWNHTFYWHCLSPWGSATPDARLGADIDATFGSLSALHDAIEAAALNHFGSGWLWLVRRPGGQLEIIITGDGQTALAVDRTPLLGIDLWEHAWYLDYQNDRAAYLKAIRSLINWDFVTQNDLNPISIAPPAR